MKKIIISILFSSFLIISAPSQAGITSKIALYASTAVVIKAINDPQFREKIMNTFRSHSDLKDKFVNKLHQVIEDPKHQGIKEKAENLLLKIRYN